MSKLISGKEALKLVADGVVQYIHSSETQERWTTITDHFWCQYNLGMFLDTNTAFKFRLNPRTITINGIEVPVPFEPKEGDDYWYMTSYGKIDTDVWCSDLRDNGRYSLFGVYRTEEEIKQVVSALRSVFKPQ